MRWRHRDGAECDLCEFKLSKAHKTLVDWFHDKKLKYINLHISCAYRDEQEQIQAYKEGKSRAIYPNSPHNKTPAMALDLFLIDEDGRARFPPLFYAKLNAENELEKRPILWGGRFKTLVDGPHFELVKKAEGGVEPPPSASHV